MFSVSGNENIYKIPRSGGSFSHSLRFDLTRKDGHKAYEEYEIDHIDNEANKYKLIAGGYSGTAGKSFSDNCKKRDTSGAINNFKSHKLGLCPKKMLCSLCRLKKNEFCPPCKYRKEQSDDIFNITIIIIYQ